MNWTFLHRGLVHAHGSKFLWQLNLQNAKNQYRKGFRLINSEVFLAGSIQSSQSIRTDHILKTSYLQNMYCSHHYCPNTSSHHASKNKLSTRDPLSGTNCCDIPWLLECFVCVLGSIFLVPQIHLRRDYCNWKSGSEFYIQLVNFLSIDWYILSWITLNLAKDNQMQSQGMHDQLALTYWRST